MHRLALVSAAVLALPALAFTNDVAVPSAHYVLDGVRNEIFVKNMIKRWRPYDDFVRFEGCDGKMFLRRLSTVATVTKPVDGARVLVALYNGDEFEMVKRVPCVLRAAKKGVGEKDVYAQIVGDSITHGRFFADAVLNSGYVPKVHLVGLLKCGEKQYSEGRGGWRLDTYFKVPKSAKESYHGFMQPADGRYWGNREFWKMAWRCVRKTQPAGFQPSYSCARFDDCVGRFDETTGVLLNPAVGDVQFDDAQGSFVRFDGAAWTKADEKSLRFGFDYSKYLAAWNVHAPDFLFVMLGTNDFYASRPKDAHADYSEWRRMICEFKESYLKANPNGKFVVCLPICVNGSSDNAAGAFSELVHAGWWNFRKWAIDTFDKREKEGFYLLDVGVAADDDHGFLELAKKDPARLPYEKYAGDERLAVQYGNPHPYSSYPAMSVPVAAFIQYWRDRR